MSKILRFSQEELEATADDPLSDPYMRPSMCINRLLEVWKGHNTLVVAVDFDDTVYDFHNKGFKFPAVLELLRLCSAIGCKIVLFSSSHPDRHQMMREYMESEGIKIQGINENLPGLPYGDHGKIFYNILLDDRAGLGGAVYILSTTLGEIAKLELQKHLDLMKEKEESE